jgi:CheY-like chemotaxis protein
MAEQWHLLIVHNERQVREVLHQIFLGAGYKCLLANDGPAGLEAFGQSRPPLVITQLNLPHRLPPSGVFGGIELLKQVRRENPNVAVIVLSDSPHRATATECLQLGAEAYIGSSVELRVRMTASPISRMLPGSLAEGHQTHQRPGLGPASRRRRARSRSAWRSGRAGSGGGARRRASRDAALA